VNRLAVAQRGRRRLAVNLVIEQARYAACECVRFTGTGLTIDIVVRIGEPGHFIALESPPL